MVKTFSASLQEGDMRNCHEKVAGNALVFGAAMFAFAIFLVPQCHAQQPGAASPAERARQRQIRRNDQMETELRISRLEKESRRPAEEDRPRLAYGQLKEDFERLQTVNNRMMAMTFSDNVLDYKTISDASAEIKKRASRLLANLPLPEPEADKKISTAFKGWNELEGGQVKPALLALDDLIMSFVNNPIFQTSESVDVKQSAKAGGDLEAVIQLSGKIKKATGKLLKN
jgi:hypothetical protein